MKTALLVSMGGAMAAAPEKPTFPKGYTAVGTMELPYAGITIPLKFVLDGEANTEEIHYYQGLQIDYYTKDGKYKWAFADNQRKCFHNMEPHATEGGEGLVSAVPDMADYTYAGKALVKGLEVEKWVANESHGSTGSMDDHLVFYYDPLLKKPIRWHQHSRNKVFGSHTDEYILNYSMFEELESKSSGFSLPKECATAVTPMQKLSFPLEHVLRRTNKVQPENISSAYRLFALHHNKHYASQEEWQRREGLFYSNQKKIEEMNKKHEGQATFKANQWLDMTVEEVMSFKGGLRKSEKKPGFFEKKSLFQKKGGVQKPENFDWRTEKPGVISPVKDQGICGSCWAFSAISAIESANALKTGKMTLLPEQFVIDCNWREELAACDGGDSGIATQNIMKRWGGIVPTAESYGSYLTVDGYCHGVQGKTVGAKVADWVAIPPRDEEATMEALLKQPLAIAFNVGAEAMYYDSGVINAAACEHNKVDELNHAINLVGYGTDEKTGLKYWTIRNSWSTYWGDEGYFKVVRGERDCGVTTTAGYPVVLGVGESSLENEIFA